MAAQALTGILITDHRSLNANTFDPANSITDVTFFTNGVALGECTSPPYRLAWSNVPVGIYSVSVRATTSGGLTTNSGTAIVLVDNGGAPALTITQLGQGSNTITGQDILGLTDQVQFVTDPQATN